MPVSYTHLDVYKRQAQLVAENIAQQLENRISFRRAMKSCMSRTMKSGALGVKTSAVSYTHLDVYKRQGADRCNYIATVASRHCWWK